MINGVAGATWLVTASSVTTSSVTALSAPWSVTIASLPGASEHAPDDGRPRRRREPLQAAPRPLARLTDIGKSPRCESRCVRVAPNSGRPLIHHRRGHLIRWAYFITRYWAWWAWWAYFPTASGKVIPDSVQSGLKERDPPVPSCSASSVDTVLRELDAPSLLCGLRHPVPITSVMTSSVMTSSVTTSLGMTDDDVRGGLFKMNVLLFDFGNACGRWPHYYR